MQLQSGSNDGLMQDMISLGDMIQHTHKVNARTVGRLVHVLDFSLVRCRCQTIEGWGVTPMRTTCSSHRRLRPSFSCRRFLKHGYLLPRVACLGKELQANGIMGIGPSALSGEAILDKIFKECSVRASLESRDTLSLLSRSVHVCRTVSMLPTKSSPSAWQSSMLREIAEHCQTRLLLHVAVLNALRFCVERADIVCLPSFEDGNSNRHAKASRELAASFDL